MKHSVFRHARPADLDAVMALIPPAQAFMASLDIDQWQDGYPERHVFEQDIALGQCYVLEEDGCLEGVMVVSFRPEPCYAALQGGQWLSHEEPYATIHRTAVRRRGSGAARAMLEGAQALCREAGVLWLRSDTHRGNAVMRRFLEREGFTLCGTVSYDDVHAGDPLRVAYEKAIL